MHLASVRPIASVPLGVATPAAVKAVLVSGEKGVTTPGALLAVGLPALVVEFVASHSGFLRLGFGFVVLAADFVAFEHICLFDLAGVF
jgi:hypothetical protein